MLGDNRTSMVASNNACGGSRWIRHFSTDYPCSGCWGCGGPGAQAAWAISRFVWCAGVAPSHRVAADAIKGFEALATIGAALVCLTQWFAALADMPRRLTVDFNRVRIGNWYVVTGGRGNAAQHKGKVGRCEWRGVSENGYNTPRCALVTMTSERFYVSEGQVSRHLPDEVEQNRDRQIDRTLRAKQEAQAAYNAAEKCTAGRGGLVVIIAGEHKDKTGEVFWTGEKNGKLRLGVRELGTQSSEKYAKRGEVIREPMWIDASESRAIEQLTAEQAGFALIRLDIALIAAEEMSSAAFSGAHPDSSRAMAALTGRKAPMLVLEKVFIHIEARLERCSDTGRGRKQARWLGKWQQRLGAEIDRRRMEKPSQGERS